MKEKYSVAVVGAGLAGLSCALALAKMGRDVVVIEEQGEPGGAGAKMPPSREYLPDPATACRAVLEEMSSLSNVKMKLGWRADEIRSESGEFVLGGSSRTGRWRIVARAVVLATGQRTVYVPGAAGEEEEEPGLVSFSSFEKWLCLPAQDRVARFRGKRVGFLLDISTTHSRRFVARALEYAARLNRDYGAESYVFCRDLQVCGYRLEDLYRRSRDSGTVVFKYEGTAPRVGRGRRDGAGSSGAFVVYLKMPSLGEDFRDVEVAVPVDILVFDEKVQGANSFQEFRRKLGPLDSSDGFFQARNPRLEPADTGRPGLWVIGTCRGDLDVEEVLAEARSAASRVDLWLSSQDPEPYIQIDADRCARCLTCVRLCPARALRIEPYSSGKKSAACVDRRACRGCGLCASVCPARAITFLRVTDEQVFDQVGSLGGRG